MKKQRIRNFCLVVLLCCGMLWATFALSGQLISIEKFDVREENQQLILSFKFDAPVNYRLSFLTNPDRLVLDLDDVTHSSHIQSTENQFIKGVRSNDHDHKYLRLVFDLKQKIKYSTDCPDSKRELTIKIAQANIIKKIKNKKFFLAAQEDSTTQNIDKVVDEASELNDPTKLSKNLPLPSVPEASCPEPEAVPAKASAKNIVVVIDPGHGGKDPGARGQQGTYEKEVVLKISKQLQSLLNEEPGFCAVMTRSTDCFIPLRQRLAIARKNHADLFIAIHADAYNHEHATGASVYALSQRGATSEAARWLAEKENESELGGLGDELADKDAILRSVLIDLSQTHTIESSLQIGKAILHNLGKLGKLHHFNVEQAAFVVLKSPDIPSVLVETGFLSNPSEEAKLSNQNYQYQTALAIKDGVKQYFAHNFAGSTWFSAEHKKNIAVEDHTSQAEVPVKAKKKHDKAKQ